MVAFGGDLQGLVDGAPELALAASESVLLPLRQRQVPGFDDPDAGKLPRRHAAILDDVAVPAPCLDCA